MLTKQKSVANLRFYKAFKRKVPRSTNARRTRGKLPSALSAIAAPSAGTLPKNVHKF